MHPSRNFGAAPVAASVRVGPATPGQAWADWLGTAMERLREKAELRGLSPRERRDAGLDVPGAIGLARKPVWRA